MRPMIYQIAVAPITPKQCSLASIRQEEKHNKNTPTEFNSQSKENIGKVIRKKHERGCSNRKQHISKQLYLFLERCANLFQFALCLTVLLNKLFEFTLPLQNETINNSSDILDNAHEVYFSQSITYVFVHKYLYNKSSSL